MGGKKRGGVPAMGSLPSAVAPGLAAVWELLSLLDPDTLRNLATLKEGGGALPL